MCVCVCVCVCARARVCVCVECVGCVGCVCKINIYYYFLTRSRLLHHSFPAQRETDDGCGDRHVRIAAIAASFARPS